MPRVRSRNESPLVNMPSSISILLTSGAAPCRGIRSGPA